MKIIEYLFSPSSFDLHGFKVEGPSILVIPSLIALIFVFVASLVWLYKDAVKRNKNGFIALLFILLAGWPGAFIVWFWLRPPLKPNT